MSEALDFPLPPTTYVVEPRTAPTAAPPIEAPAFDDVPALRGKVAELEQVVSLAKTRVETLGAEKREALERALELKAQLDAAKRREAELLERLAAYESGTPAEPRFDQQTVAELVSRVAALEAIVAPSRAA